MDVHVADPFPLLATTFFHGQVDQPMDVISRLI